MDRILERFRKGSGPPVRITDLAEVTGLSRSYIHSLIDDGSLTPAAHRVGGRTYLIPIKEAAKLARDLGLIE